MLVLFGDSHSHAINFGFDQLSRREKLKLWLKFGRMRGGSLGPATNYRQNFFTAFPDRIYFTGEVAKRQTELLADQDPFFQADDRRRFVFSLGFHHPIYKSAIWKKYTIDPSNTEKQYISHAAFRDILLASNAPILEFYRALRKLHVGFIVIATPPPQASYMAATKGDIPAKEFIAVFERTRAVFAEELDRIGVRHFHPPAKVAGPKGFLKRELCASARPRDHHGNAKYGRIFLRDVISNARSADFYGPNWSMWGNIKRKVVRVLRRIMSIFDKKPRDSLEELALERAAARRAVT